MKTKAITIRTIGILCLAWTAGTGCTSSAQNGSGAANPLVGTTGTPARSGQYQIAEGKGWNGFKLGATRAELIQALGQPDSDSDNRWMKWEQAHVHCLVDDVSGAFELRFDEGFPGLTTAGIGIGSHLKDALAAYGEPSSQKNDGSAKKLLWDSKGILIWFHEDRAAQIVVFQKTVGITGTPARSGQYQIAEGKGWNGFKLGATRAELIQALGQPDSDSDNRWMKWEQAHVHCLVDDVSGAFELRFDEGFPGLTTAGIGIGSPLKDALAAYGEPSSQKNDGSAKKLLWDSKGILIWFHEDRAAQIVVFQKTDNTEERERQGSLPVTFKRTTPQTGKTK